MRDRLGANGAICAAAAVALAAYASHAAAPDDRARLFIAAAFGFGHGLAMAALSPLPLGRLGRAGLWAAYLGMLLFAGSLVLAAFAGASTQFAPFGGMAMIGGWLLFAIDRWRG